VKLNFIIHIKTGLEHRTSILHRYSLGESYWLLVTGRGYCYEDGHCFVLALFTNTFQPARGR